MENKTIRFLSLLLALVMVIGMMPVTHAHAEGEAVDILSAPVTEVQADVEYELFFGGNRGVYAGITTRDGFTGLDSGTLSTTAIASNARYIWTLKAADNGGYRIYNADQQKYVKIVKNTASLVDEAEADIFDFTYFANAGAFAVKARNVPYGYFNNLGSTNIIGGWNDNGTKIAIRQVLRNHVHNYVDVPAVEPTLNSTGMTAGTVCSCGSVASGRETIAARNYNEGIVPLDKLTATAGTYENANAYGDGGPDYAIDNNLGGTKWHSKYGSGVGDNVAANHWIDLAIDGDYAVTSLAYYAQSHGGQITNYEIQVSYDGEEYETVATGTWDTAVNWKEVKFAGPLVQAKNIRLKAISTAGNQYVIANEIRLFAESLCQHTNTTVVTGTAPTLDNTGLTDGIECADCGHVIQEQEVIPATYNVGIVPKEHVTLTVGTWEKNGNANEGSADLAWDDNFNTMWHTDWGGTTADKLWIQFNLSENYDATALRYKPRAGAKNGTATTYEIQVSHDGENFFTVKTGTWAETDSWKVAEFDAHNAKIVRLVVVEFVCDQENKKLASAAEVRLVGTPTNHEHDFVTTTTPATCTNDGSTTITCSGCGDTHTTVIPATGHVNTSLVGAKEATCGADGYTGDLVCACGEIVEKGESIPATGNHTYSSTYDVTCDVCGETREVAKFSIYKANMILESNLKMVFCFEKAAVEGETGLYAIITKNGVEQRVDFAAWDDTNAGKKSATKDYYYVTCTNIAAKEMTDEITVTIYSDNGQISKTWTDSVQAYAIRGLKADTTSKAYKSALMDMLNYGAAAQVNANYNLEKLANEHEDLEDYKDYGTDSVTYTNAMTNSAGIKYLANVRMAENIKFMMAFAGLDKSAVITVSYTPWNATEATVKTFTVAEMTKDNGYYVITMEDTAIADAFATFTVTITDATGEVGVITDSMASYAARAAEKGKTALADSIMKFASAVKAYKGV